MQYSLFSKRPLFDDVILNRRRNEWATEPLPGFEARISAVRDFWRSLSVTKGRRKETALEQEFNRAVFVELLGYRLYPGLEGAWTAWPKPATDATRLAGEPDLLLGNFNNAGTFEALTVVELKRPKTSLDAPQPTYENRTPVEQAFDYAKRLPTCRWVIVSNMEILRLYAINFSDEYHELDLEPIAPGRNDNYRDLYRLAGYDYLIDGGTDSSTSRLLAAARDEQASFREGFYKIYVEMRDILLDTVDQWCEGKYDRNTQILAVQRLLDRLLFIYFCEDHPDGLLRNGLVKEITELALRLPGSSTTKAYEQLKALFRELDIGVRTPFRQIPKYNGELFKYHRVVDELMVEDELSTRRFAWTSPTQGRRVVEGIYGLHVFDFWREFDRDLLGNLFERSVGDLTALAHGGRPDARKAFGIFYTASRLARFVASSAVGAMLDKDAQLKAAITRASTNQFTDPNDIIDEIVALLCQYQIADLACGSGVFLTAALDSLLSPYKKALEAIAVGLNKQLLGFRQSEVLKASIYGVDLLPQAVELAKLALWLTAARRNERSADLSGNFVVGDALTQCTVDDLLQKSRQQFDLILGNPPWGGDFDSEHGTRVLHDLGLPSTGQANSWEVFLALVVSSLKPGGRFAILIPDTIFSVDKRRTREWLVRRCKLEKVYSLGPDWFTANVRMSTVVLQGTTERFEPDHAISTLALAGKNRRDAQSGYRPLGQLEASLRQELQQQRCVADPEKQIQVLASDWELEFVSRIEARSVELDHQRSCAWR